MEGVDLRSQMWHAIGLLTPPLRTALVLRYYEDLDDQEIAAAVGWSQSTVRANVSRALADLRRTWRELNVDEELHL
jgi:RNA polymerase sigma factor (sigma-70 family)